MIKVPQLRWWVAGLLFFAALLNYIDRNVLGLLADRIQQDLHISTQEYASIVNYFLIAYTIANLLSGRVVDKLGVRWSLALFVAWWTVANALTGFARSLSHLCGLRFLLGLGEAGCYTASPKVVAEWFPLSERGAAIGLYSSGGAVGATIAPLIVGADGHRWRWVFALTPLLASVWMVLWLLLYRKPAGHPLMTEKERAYLAENLPPAKPQAQQPKESEWALWGRVVREPLVWLLMLARLLTDPVWYFFQFWFPKYLRAMHGLNQQGVAIMWLIFLAATLGFVLGGYFSGRLIKRGHTPASARMWMMLASACVAPLFGLIPWIPPVYGVIALAMLVAYAATSWLSNISALIVDLVPQRILGTSFGLIACGSALGGFFMNKGVAWLIDHRSYNDCFYLLTLVYPLTLLMIWHLRKRQAPV